MTSAPELFARTQGKTCRGPFRCHWCGSPCEQTHLHDDAPPIPFVRSTSPAFVPSSPYCCEGCYLWRMRSRTVRFLTPAGTLSQRDRQAAKDHSWLLLPAGALGLRPWDLALPTDPETVFHFLLQPTTPFGLILKRPGAKIDTLLQLAAVNDEGDVTQGSVLRFTVDNTPHEYTVYELHEALKTGDREGKRSGVRVLLEAFGPYTLPGVVEERKKGRPGQPSVDGKVLQKPVHVREQRRA